MERPTLKEVYDLCISDLKSRCLDGSPIPKLSLLSILSGVFAGACHLQYGFLEWIWKQHYIEKASEIGLTWYGSRYKLPRKGATKTSGFIAPTGTSLHAILSGTKFVNSEGFEYISQSDFIIGLTESVEVIADDYGAAYNTQDVFLELVEIDSDVDDEILIVSGFSNGEDIELLNDWRYRLLQRARNIPGSGSIADYERWALSIEGIGKAFCIPGEQWLGAGTVALIVSTKTLEQVTSSVLTALEDYIQIVKPVPAKVYYFNATPIDVDFNISLSPNTAEMRESIDAALTSLFLQETRPGSPILLSHVRQAIGSTSPYDYEITDVLKNTVSLGLIDIESTIPECLKYESTVYVDL